MLGLIILMKKKFQMIKKGGLTERRKQILETIIQFINENNRSPLIREIANELGLTDPTISSHLDKLEDQGYIKRQEGQGIMIKETPPYSEYELVRRELIEKALKVLNGEVTDEDSKEIVIQNLQSKLRKVY